MSSFPMYNITMNSMQCSQKLVKKSLIVKCCCKSVFLKVCTSPHCKRNMYVLNGGFHNFHDTQQSLCAFLNQFKRKP